MTCTWFLPPHLGLLGGDIETSPIFGGVISLYVSEYKNYLQFILDIAQKIITDTGGYSPHIFWCKDDKVYASMIVSEGNPRYIIKSLTDAVIHKVNPDWIAIVTTAWSIIRDKDDESYTYGEASKDPNRKEVLLGFLVTRDGHKFAKVYEIVRLEEDIEFDEFLEDILDGFLVPEPWG